MYPIVFTYSSEDKESLLSPNWMYMQETINLSHYTFHTSPRTPRRRFLSQPWKERRPFDVFTARVLGYCNFVRFLRLYQPLTSIQKREQLPPATDGGGGPLFSTPLLDAGEVPIKRSPNPPGSTNKSPPYFWLVAKIIRDYTSKPLTPWSNGGCELRSLFQRRILQGKYEAPSYKRAFANIRNYLDQPMGSGFDFVDTGNQRPNWDGRIAVQRACIVFNTNEDS